MVNYVQTYVELALVILEYPGSGIRLLFPTPHQRYKQVRHLRCVKEAFEPAVSGPATFARISSQAGASSGGEGGAGSTNINNMRDNGKKANGGTSLA